MLPAQLAWWQLESKQAGTWESCLAPSPMSLAAAERSSVCLDVCLTMTDDIKNLCFVFKKLKRNACIVNGGHFFPLHLVQWYSFNSFIGISLYALSIGLVQFGFEPDWARWEYCIYGNPYSEQGKAFKAPASVRYSCAMCRLQWLQQTASPVIQTSWSNLQVSAPVGNKDWSFIKTHPRLRVPDSLTGIH